MRQGALAEALGVKAGVRGLKGAQARVAELLGTTAGAAGLLIERRAFCNGQAVEVTQSYYRGDAYDFVAELTLSGGGTP